MHLPGRQECRISEILVRPEYFLSLMLFLLMLNNGSYQLAGWMPLAYTLTHYVAIAVIGLFFLLFILCHFDRAAPKLILLLLVALTLTMLNGALFPDLSRISIELFCDFAFYCIPAIVAAWCITSPSLLLGLLRRFSGYVTLVVAGLLLFHFVYSVPNGNQAYSMGLGYAILPFVLVQIEGVFGRLPISSRIWKIVCLTVAFLGMVILGSRGPLLCVSCLVVCLFLRYALVPEHGGIALIVVTAFVLTLLLLRPLLEFASSVMSGFGFSRIGYLLEEYLTTGDIHLSGRDVLQAPLLDAFLQYPVDIRGIGSDRLLIGMNAHNLFIEQAYSFGLLGLVISICIVAYCLFRVVTLPASDYATLCVLFFSASIPYIMVSGSYLDSILLWIMLPLVFSHRLRSGSKLGLFDFKSPSRPTRAALKDACD